ncbi:Peptidase inhibitor family I36 [Lentzea fradiae]|uniref:Peptidase inhibitor family I36 n=1 Tax=Lentzea fradiae TaxID=200378 RepID=A0A1G7VQF4_9PSEU|nr:peptidase inhibitor family I36 protein [Lentzea fradiae]SDG61140.1 Peptidase inhibitor family I36 [Lentzea fradiae]
MSNETIRTGRRGRVAKPPEGDGPVAVFARRLWELKRCAGDPSYDVMRREHGALASKSALSAAARGAQLPSWTTTWEFVRPLAVGVLGRDEERVRAEWRQRWDRAAAAVPAPAVVLPVERPAARAGTRGPGSGWWALVAALVAGVALVAAFWTHADRPVVRTIAEPCEASWLCLYRNIGFDDMNFRTQRQNACWNLADYHLRDAVFSYDNNTAITARFFDSQKNEVGDIRAGGSSQDSSALLGAQWFCTGSARP